MRRQFWMAIALLAISVPLFADQATLGLDDAVSIALKNNLDIKQAELDLAAAQADLRGAYADLFMPTLQLAGSYAYTDQTTQTYPFNDTGSAGLQIVRTLFAGGRYWFAKESKRFAAELAEYKLNDIKKTTIRNTRINFYSLLLLKERLRVARDFDKSLKDHLDSARVNYQNGLASRLDFLKAQVKYKNDQPVLAQAQNSYLIGKLTFIRAIGLSDDRDIEPAGDLADAAKVTPVLIDEAKIIALALQNDIGIRTADYGILMSQANTDTIWSARLPTVNGSFNYGYSTKAAAGGSRSFSPALSFSFSAVIPLDAWIPYVSKASNQLASGESLVAKLKLQREQAVSALSTRVKSLLLFIAYAAENIDGQKDNVAQAKLALDLATKQYREGGLSSLDLSDTEISYAQAQTNYLQALYDNYSSVLQLNDLIE